MSPRPRFPPPLPVRRLFPTLDLEVTSVDVDAINTDFDEPQGARHIGNDFRVPGTRHSRAQMEAWAMSEGPEEW